MKCINCGNEMEVQRGQEHHYASSGLPNVYLQNIETRVCPSCGECEVALPNVEQLHRVLAHAVISKKAPLTAAEFRFLRKQLGWSSQDLAHRFGVDPSTVSRWENEADPLSRLADRMIRLCVAQFTPVDDYSADDMDAIDTAVASSADPLRIRRGRGGWSESEARA